MRCSSRILLLSAAALFLSGSPHLSMAQSLYTVQLNTQSLISNSAGPFSLDFQLIDGDGVVNNTATMNNFHFGAGSATGTPTLTGSATGDASTSVSLADSGFFNEFSQGFTPGQILNFNMALSANFAGGFPDELSFALLQSSGHEVPTNGPANALFTVDFDGSKPTINTYMATGDFISLGSPAIQSSVPAPSSILTLLVGFAPGFLALRRKKFLPTLP